MIQTKRNTATSIATGIVTLSFASVVYAANPNAYKPDTDEAYMIAEMASRHIPTFVLLNKKSGQIKIVQDKKIIYVASALTGKTIGDTADQDNITPAGIFPTLPSENAIVFSTAANGRPNSIHPVINPAGQNRPQRLKSKTAKDNRISDGCINVSTATFNKLSQALSISPKTIWSPEKNAPVYTGMAGFMVVLPETMSAQTYFKPATP